jgi:microsomal dipeptidase-like Zn-dependent dipeptidase
MISRNKSRIIPYFDAHCDTLTLAADTNRDLFCTYNEAPFALRLSEESFSPRAQVFAIYGDSAIKGFDPDKRFFSAYSHFQRQLDKYPEKLLFCKSSQDIEKAKTEGKIASFLSYCPFKRV